MASLLRCPTYSCHHRPSSFPTRGGLHCQAHQLATKAKVLSEKPTTFATNSTTFTQKSPVFHRFLWRISAQRPTIGEKVHRAGENAPQIRRRIPWFLRPRWGYCCSSPLFPSRKRGDVFALRLQPARTTCRREGKGEGGRKCRRAGAEARAERRGHKGTKKRRQT